MPVYMYWSQLKSVSLLVCWWNVGSLKSHTVFKSSKWNFLHMIPMACRYEARPKGSRVLIYMYSYFLRQRVNRGVVLITISDISSYHLLPRTSYNNMAQLTVKKSYLKNKKIGKLTNSCSATSLPAMKLVKMRAATKN